MRLVHVGMCMHADTWIAGACIGSLGVCLIVKNILWIMIADGEHFFIDADSKLHKMAPTGWREGAKGHMPPVTFTVFLRVKFYPESLAHFRSVGKKSLRKTLIS